MMTTLGWFYIGLVLLMSLVALAVYRWDKRQSMKDSRKRVSEGTLHLIEVLGGWLGGLIARIWFKHKSQKMTFRLRSWGILAAHLAGIAFWCWLKFRATGE